MMMVVVWCMFVTFIFFLFFSRLSYNLNQFRVNGYFCDQYIFFFFKFELNLFEHDRTFFFPKKNLFFFFCQSVSQSQQTSNNNNNKKNIGGPRGGVSYELHRSFFYFLFLLYFIIRFFFWNFFFFFFVNWNFLFFFVYLIQFVMDFFSDSSLEDMKNKKKKKNITFLRTVSKNKMSVTDLKIINFFCCCCFLKLIFCVGLFFAKIKIIFFFVWSLENWIICWVSVRIMIGFLSGSDFFYNF